MVGAISLIVFFKVIDGESGNVLNIMTHKRVLLFLLGIYSQLPLHFFAIFSTILGFPALMLLSRCLLASTTRTPPSVQ